MRKVYAYLRVSGLGQVKGDGLKRQLEVIRAYAKRAGYEVVEVFREEGVSGAVDETQRPAFEAMVSAILQDGVDTVIVEGMDRLARKSTIQELLISYLASKEIRLLSARTETDITAEYQADPMKRALIQIQGVFSELEKSLLVKKLRVARERKRAETGRCEGRKPYGETEEERAVIHRIRLMRRRRKRGLKGMSLQAIADRLNAEGIPTKAGARWTPTQVRRVLAR
ncbi:MAG: recombinase family protein [Deltaproteobacteria bacterium]|nr:recombinase family protein [Deltaproteobacteria bacterium]